MFVQSSVICPQLDQVLLQHPVLEQPQPVTTELPTAMRSSFALETPYNLLYCCLYHWHAIYTISVPSNEVLDFR